jgi:hypothetical protein
MGSVSARMSRSAVGCRDPAARSARRSTSPEVIAAAMLKPIVTSIPRSKPALSPPVDAPTKSSLAAMATTATTAVPSAPPTSRAVSAMPPARPAILPSIPMNAATWTDTAESPTAGAHGEHAGKQISPVVGVGRDATEVGETGHRDQLFDDERRPGTETVHEPWCDRRCDRKRRERCRHPRDSGHDGGVAQALLHEQVGLHDEREERAEHERSYDGGANERPVPEDRRRHQRRLLIRHATRRALDDRRPRTCGQRAWSARRVLARNHVAQPRPATASIDGDRTSLDRLLTCQR